MHTLETSCSLYIELSPQDRLIAVVATIMGYRMESVELVGYSGRMIHVRYTPELDHDPDIVLSIENSESGNALNALVIEFQSARLRRWNSRQAKFVRLRMIADNIAVALLKTNPTRYEVVIMAKWLLMARTQV